MSGRQTQGPNGGLDPEDLCDDLDEDSWEAWKSWLSGGLAQSGSGREEGRGKRDGHGGEVAALMVAAAVSVLIVWAIAGWLAR